VLIRTDEMEWQARAPIAAAEALSRVAIFHLNLTDELPRPPLRPALTVPPRPGPSMFVGAASDVREEVPPDELSCPGVM
jgi:hypothetical protein